MPEEISSMSIRSWLPSKWRGWVGWSLLLAVVLVSPWFTALFFAPASTIAGVIVAIASLIAIRFRGSAPDRQIGHFSMTDPKLWAIIYAFYMLLTNFWSASLVNSIQVTLLEISALLLFMLVSQHAGLFHKIFVPAFSLVGIALYVYGMGDAVHWWTATDAVYDKHLLASVFEYHNTFGAMLLAVGLVAYCAGINYSKWWGNILGTLAFIVSIDSVLGSYSRIVWVLAPIAYLIAFIVKPIMQKTIWPAITGVVLAIFAGGSAYFELKALNNGISKDLVYTLIIMAVGAVAVSFAEKWASKKRFPLKIVVSSLVALVVIAGALAVVFRHHLFHTTTSISARISTISFKSVSLQERFYYYKNAMHMWANAPIFGGGGGTWDAKFQSFQTIPYWSTQAHSNVIDHFLNGGLIGFALWIVLLVMLLIRFIQALRNKESSMEERLFRMGFALAGIFMFGHAVLDFDFSFGYYQYIFWILMALAASPYVEMETAINGLSGKWVLSITWVTGIVVSLFGISLGTSQVFGQLAKASSQDINNQLGDTQIAAFFAPYDPNLQLSLAQYDMQTAASSQDQSLYSHAWNHVQNAAGYGLWDPNIQTQVAVIAYQLGHMPQAVSWSDRAYQDAPFNSVAIRNMLGIKLWDSASIFKSDPAFAKTQLQDIVNKYNDFSSVNKGINYKLFPDAAPVQTDASMQVYIGAANYLLGNYQASLKAMNPFLKANRDQAAVNLFEIITVLDHQKMHAKPSKLDQLFMQQIKSNPSALSEYQYIVKQSQ